jgi:hypothetical protein
VLHLFLLTSTQKAANHAAGQHAQQRPEQRGANPDLPVLQYGQEASRSLLNWEAKMTVRALEKYGNLGRMFQLNGYYGPAPIEAPPQVNGESSFSAMNDPDGIFNTLHLNKHKERQKEIAMMEQARPYVGQHVHREQEQGKGAREFRRR